jgi:hypothetical protein
MKPVINPSWLSLAVVLIASIVVSQAQTNTNPAARTHVKIVDGQPIKFSSKLQKVIELNFTFGFHHSASKPIIANTLTRVATNYGTETTPAFTVQRHVGPNGGSSSGLPTPDFTLADLNSAQVIFANQISAMGSNSLGAARRTAIQTAVEGGVGYFHLHGSGDDETRAWSWYTNVLHPMNYASHGANTNGPVYKNPVERAHIVSENVLETGMDDTRAVPTSVDASSNEVLTQEPIRMIRNEWYRFGNDIRTDPAHSSKVTVLSLYDPRGLTSELAAQYRRKGGNMYTYLFKVGNGMSHYLPAGHDNLEIMGTDGFDGGVGDWDRYFAQVLFFLAGYNETPCDNSCIGLPVVSAENRLTGSVYTTSINGFKLLPRDVQLHTSKLEFSFVESVDYRAQVLDVTGKTVMQASGHGTGHAFDQSRLQPGVYFMRVTMTGASSPAIKRYVISATR